MKTNFIASLMLKIIVAATLVMYGSTALAWTDGQDASQVIGQPDFTSVVADFGDTGLGQTYDIAVDAPNGKLYIVDGYRVLRYEYPFTGNQPAAELVFGQPTFSSISVGSTQNTFDNPRGIEVDTTGRLWVADAGNNRVLWFDAAYGISTNQPDADGVLGQPDFTTNTEVTTQRGMAYPMDFAITTDGTLFVSEFGNHRVLRFENAALKSNGGYADGVLGQADFLTNTATTTPSGMASPRGLALYLGSLFVADRTNARVLRFDNATSLADGADADVVFGQTDFVSVTKDLTQSGMDAPGRVAVDHMGRLYVSDGFNFDRIVIFNDALATANGVDAANVLGQTDFFTLGTGLTASTIDLDSSAGGMFMDYTLSTDTRLLLADHFNNRVLIYVEPDTGELYTGGNADDTSTYTNDTTGSSGGGCFLNTVEDAN